MEVGLGLRFSRLVDSVAVLKAKLGATVATAEGDADNLGAAWERLTGGGGVRRFALKHRRDAALKGVLELPHGSLLVMSGDTQRLYRHALPRTSRVVAPRINLTFRQVDPARRR